MRSFTFTSLFGQTDVVLEVASYTYNPLSIAILLKDAEDRTPYTTATVNIGKYTGNGSVLGPYCAFLDTNNNPTLEEFLIRNHLAKPYTRFGEPVYGASGFVEYPLYEFDPELLRQIDPEGCAQYEQEYEKELRAYQADADLASYGLDYSWLEEDLEYTPTDDLEKEPEL
ncbi:MAG: DUF4313 domain-containing protein [Lachnospiraceae bacterium]|nr:DUF4313 domain-containing protein [Lachnospiraceae bacterium]